MHRAGKGFSNPFPTPYPAIATSCDGDSPSAGQKPVMSGSRSRLRRFTSSPDATQIIGSLHGKKKEKRSLLLFICR
ncbi:MAG: hypothetical protein HW387_1096 [Parachlamydiales bacterium]|nr:hypothetical protein [Parachlamydiales bacterium]